MKERKKRREWKREEAEHAKRERRERGKRVSLFFFLIFSFLFLLFFPSSLLLLSFSLLPRVGLGKSSFLGFTGGHTQKRREIQQWHD